MTRTRAVIAVALGGSLFLVAALLARRPETVVPGKPLRPGPIPRESVPPTAADGRPALSAQLREAEEELLSLCDKRDQLLRRMKEVDQASVAGAGSLKVTMSAAADEHYRRAEKYYQAGVYERAEAECREAIDLIPDHPAARALLNEIRLVVGKRSGTPSTPR